MLKKYIQLKKFFLCTRVDTVSFLERDAKDKSSAGFFLSFVLERLPGEIRVQDSLGLSDHCTTHAMQPENETQNIMTCRQQSVLCVFGLLMVETSTGIEKRGKSFAKIRKH